MVTAIGGSERGGGGWDGQEHDAAVTFFLSGYGKIAGEKIKCSCFVVSHSRKTEIKQSYPEREAIKTHANIHSKTKRIKLIKLRQAIPVLLYDLTNP